MGLIAYYLPDSGCMTTVGTWHLMASCVLEAACFVAVALDPVSSFVPAFIGGVSILVVSSFTVTFKTKSRTHHTEHMKILCFWRVNSRMYTLFWTCELIRKNWKTAKVGAYFWLYFKIHSTSWNGVLFTLNLELNKIVKQLFIKTNESTWHIIDHHLVTLLLCPNLKIFLVWQVCYA
jgi:hypothetical protein